MAIESLYTKVTNIEKKQKALNFYVNFAESFQAEHSSKTEEWTTRFYNKKVWRISSPDLFSVMHISEKNKGDVPSSRKPSPYWSYQHKILIYIREIFLLI